MKDRVSISIENHVADVRLIRSDKMNALDDAMLDALVEATEVIEANGDIRCVVLSGEGKGFCAGLDLTMFDMSGGGLQKMKLAERTHDICNKPQKVVWGWRELSVPVIAAVHGVALGGGLQIMLGSDIRYVHPDTKLSIMELKWGIIPDMSSTQIMRHLVRDDVVRELTYTARVFSGRDAVDYGFATHLSDDPHADAMKLAHEIAGKNPHAIQASKKLIQKAPYCTVEEGLLMESELQDAIIGTKNQIEAVFSSMQKRPGKYGNAR